MSRACEDVVGRCGLLKPGSRRHVPIAALEGHLARGCADDRNLQMDTATEDIPRDVCQSGPLRMGLAWPSIALGVRVPCPSLRIFEELLGADSYGTYLLGQIPTVYEKSTVTWASTKSSRADTASAFAFRSFPLLIRLPLAFAPLSNKRHHFYIDIGTAYEFQ